MALDLTDCADVAARAFRPMRPDSEAPLSYGEVARWGKLLGARDYVYSSSGRGHPVFESFKASGLGLIFDGAAEQIFKTAFVTGAREEMRRLGHGADGQ